MTIHDALATLQHRYCTLQQTAPLDDDFAQLLATQCADGTWPDIDYAGSGPRDWLRSIHAGRLARLARVYTRKGHRLAGDPAVLEAICRGVDHWLLHRYQFENWWYNSIGIPRDMAVVAMLMDTHLGSERREGVLSILDQSGVPTRTAEGICFWPGYVKMAANLVWTAWNVLYRACLRKDAMLLGECVSIIWDEIAVGNSEGIQPDGTFYQHDARVQNFHYGLQYFRNVCELAWIVRDTPWALPEATRKTVSLYLLECTRWMCRGDMTVPGSMDRAVSNPDYLRVPDLFYRQLTLWREIAPEDTEQVDDLIACRTDGRAVVQGFLHFPWGDFTAYHRPHFSLFLKTVSTRTELSESLLSENLRGVPYLNCGDHYLLQHGDEYFNMPPVWEWSQLPGLTMSPHASQPVRMPFVGGVGNEQSGCAVMQYARQQTAPVLDWALRKFWAFHGELMVCLQGGWQVPPGMDELTTSLEQSRRRGPVQVGMGDGVQTLPDGEHRLAGARWVLHRQVGYLPIAPATLQLQLSEVTGTWETINAEYAQEPPVSEPRFLLQLCHSQPLAGSGFVLIGDADAAQLDAMLSNPPWTILANDDTQQSLCFTDGTTMAACYAAGVVREGNEELLRVDRPCLAIWTDSHLWVSDPTWNGGQLQVTWCGDDITLDLPGEGQTVCLCKW